MALLRQDEKRRRKRAVATAWGLAAFAIVVFLLTVLKLGGDVLNRPL